MTPFYDWICSVCQLMVGTSLFTLMTAPYGQMLLPTLPRRRSPTGPSVSSSLPALPLETPLPLSSGRAPAMDASLDQGTLPLKAASLSGPLLPAPAPGPTLVPSKWGVPSWVPGYCPHIVISSLLSHLHGQSVPLLQLLTLFQFQSVPIILLRYYLTEVMLG